MPTTNNNWPTPVATDLVKDGWEAIKDLGDAIDTTLGVYAPVTPGLVKLQTVTFSAVSSVSLPASTFTSTYENYRIIITGTGSAGGDLDLRLRASGSDNSTSNYYYWGTNRTNAGATNAFQGVGTNRAIASATGTVYGHGVLDIFNPQVASPTLITSTGSGINASTSSAIWVNSAFGLTTQFDSATFLVASGTITGTLYAYGYNK